MSEHADRSTGADLVDVRQPRTAQYDVDVRLAGLLGALNTAATQAEVGQVVAAHAAGFWAARGAAVGVVDGAAVRLLGSVGYDCGAMEAGARLPVTAGLPLTEAARRGALTTQSGSDGAGWVAAPLPGPARPLGAIVLSLAPDSAAVDVGLLTEIAEHASSALRRIGTVAGAPPIPRPADPTELDVATHQAGATGTSSGDVIDVIDCGAAGCWIVVADVCGSDLEAARVARDVALLSRAVAPIVPGPGALLQRLDAVLRDGITDRFVTALAIRLVPISRFEWQLELASAGHPLPLLVRGGVVVDIGTPGLPLNLETATLAAERAEARAVLRSGDVLLLASDGLTDRSRGTVTDAELAAAVQQSVTAADCAAARLAHLLAAITRLHGPSRDDLAVVLVGIP